MVMKGITITAIKLMLSVLILGMLVTSGAAREAESHGQLPNGGHNNYGQPPNGGHNNDFGHYDWLNPGGVTYSYGGWNNYPYTYPNYYPTYTYPTYHYTAPVVYPTYTYTYTPFVYN
jgi:hypothetical protein